MLAASRLGVRHEVRAVAVTTGPETHAPTSTAAQAAAATMFARR